MITGSGFIGNDLARIEMHVDEKDGEVFIRDITCDYACLALWGPKARAVLGKITLSDVSNTAHPYLTTKPININSTKVYAQRVSYAGELGWELYIPNNRATPVWDLLMEAGGRSLALRWAVIKYWKVCVLKKDFVISPLIYSVS